MDNSEEIVKKRSETLQKWLKNPANLTLVLIVAAAVIIRVYYFFMAKGQAHWWDTLAFGGIAKQILLGYWTDNAFLAHEIIIRPPILSLAWAFLLQIGFSDASILFIAEIIPSALSIVFVFLICRELYNEKVGLAASFIAAISWLHLFYSLRVMSDVPALFFSLASIYFFIKSHENFSLKPFALSIFFMSLAVLTRYFYGIIGGIYILILIITQRHRFLQKKNFWIGGIIGAIPIIIFFIYNLINYNALLPAAETYIESATEKPGFAWYVLGFMPHIFGKIFVALLIVGTILALGEILLGFDNIIKVKRLRSNFFVMLLLVFPLAFFIFFLRAAEDRYLLLAFLPLVVFISQGALFIYEQIKRYSKNIAVLIVIGLLLYGVYAQLSYGDNIIKERAGTYAQMRDAFLWIKENTEPGSVLAGAGIDPYAIYYSERKIVAYNESNINGTLAQADYVVLHGFEYQTQELIDIVNAGSVRGEFTPVHVVFFDSEQKQPAVIVYRINKNITS